jgi:hypothetical protein
MATFSKSDTAVGIKLCVAQRKRQIPSSKSRFLVVYEDIRRPGTKIMAIDLGRTPQLWNERILNTDQRIVIAKCVTLELQN